jgi:trk system potassium uptake protein TrkH
LNFRLVFRQLGLVLIVLSGILLLIASGSLFLRLVGTHPTDPHARAALFITAGLGLLAGGAMWWPTRRTGDELRRREALMLVGLAWVAGAVLAATPYFLWADFGGHAEAGHPFHDPLNCYFEAMSGLTTTGATIITDLRSMPRSLLLWRATTHWLGGLGIVVLFVAILPSLGMGGKRLVLVEAAVHSQQGVRPHIRQTARALWLIYLAITVAGVIALWIAGMNVLDAICHCFAAIATGGFGTENGSVGHYRSVATDVIIILLMLLGALNFGVYYRLLTGKARTVWQDRELRLYLAVLLVGGLLVIVGLLGAPHMTTNHELLPSGAGRSVRYGLFNYVSMQTDTGFATADFNRWPFLPTAVLLGATFVGGCSGSTTGGIKVFRLLTVGKIVFAQLERTFRPNLVRPIRIGRDSLDPEQRIDALVYVITFALLLFLGGCTLMLLEGGDRIGFRTACTASLATLCTAGPGLGKAGPLGNYEWFGGASKLVMTGLMLTGRLEIFAILVLFTPRFWRQD